MLMNAQGRGGVWIIDVNGITDFANYRMAEILGTTVVDLIGNTSFEYMFPQDTERTPRLFDGERALQPFCLHLRRKDGSPSQWWSRAPRFMSAACFGA
jgi:PAS domain S-box-containing protein